MIPFKEIIESLPFALAYCRVMDTQNVRAETIQIQFFNEQFMMMHEISLVKKNTMLMLSDTVFEAEKKENILHHIAYALNTLTIQKIKHTSTHLKRDCRITIVPMDSSRFILSIKSDKQSSNNFLETREELEMINERMSQMAEFGRIFIWEIDLEGEYTYVSPAITSVLGYKPEEIIGKTIFDFHPKKGREPFKKSVLEDFKQQKRVSNYENPMVAQNGKILWVTTNGFPVYDEQGEILGYRGFDQDITRVKQSQKALAESEEKYRLLTESVSDVLWIYNNEHQKFTYVSSSIYKLSEYTVEQFLRLSIHDVIHENSLRNVVKTVKTGIQAFIDDETDSNHSLIEAELIKKDHKSVWVELSFSYRYSEQNELEIVGVGRDIHDRKLAQQELQYVTFHDTLTGLYNRSFYETEITRLYVKRNLPFSLILADINDLKLTNDAFGHLEGDVLIQEFGKILKESCREDDIVARIGGDEFVLLLPQTDEIQTQNIMDRITQSIHEATTSKLLMSVAMGSVTTKDTIQDFSSLFVKAEEAMYKRKLRDKKHKRKMKFW